MARMKKQTVTIVRDTYQVHTLNGSYSGYGIARVVRGTAAQLTQAVNGYYGNCEILAESGKLYCGRMKRSAMKRWLDANAIGARA